MSRVTLPPLVALRWLDAHATTNTPYELHEIPHKAQEITTYGLLLRDDAEGVTVANEYCGAGIYRGTTFVLRNNVIEVKPVKPTRKRKESNANPRKREAVPAADVQRVNGANRQEGR